MSFVIKNKTQIKRNKINPSIKRNVISIIPGNVISVINLLKNEMLILFERVHKNFQITFIDNEFLHENY